MISKLITDRNRSSDTVGATGEANADELGTKLTSVFTRHLRAGEVMPDMALFARLTARHLTSHAEALVAADSAHELEVGDDVAPRVERDVSETELRDRVVTYRNVIAAGHGEATLRAHGISTPAPTDTRGLLRYATELNVKLLDATLAPTTPPPEGIVINRAGMAAQLAPLISRLDAAVKVVTREAAELVVTQTAKDKALVANDEAFSGVANTLEGLLTLAGRKDLADRVRPSPRRPGVVDLEPIEPVAT